MTTVVYEPSHTTHWKNLFPSKTLLLGSHNLNEGEELIATMAEVQVQQIKNKDGKDESVPVVKFTNAPPMVLNITNTRTIASLYGPNYEQWKGRSIQVYATMVKAFGKNEMALRIREAIPDTNQDVSQYADALKSCTTLKDLQGAWLKIPKHLQPKLEAVKNEMKEACNVPQN